MGDINVSPFQHLLTTNALPNEYEIAEVNEFCVEKEKELQGLTQEIQALEDTLGELYARKRRVAPTVGSHRAIVSVLRGLCPEVLARIFSFCLPSQHRAILHPLDAPLLLGQVCRRWRDVVYTSSELWSSIHIVIPRKKTCIKRRLAIIKEWLNRSGKLPLKITLTAESATVFSSPPSTPFADIALYLKVLVSFAPRWSSLELNLPETGCGIWLKQLSSIKGRNVPLLKEFSLRFFDGGHFVSGFEEVAPPLAKHLSFLRDAPNLRDVTLTDYTYSPTSPLFAPTNRVRNLVMFFSRSYPIAFLHHLFATCKALETCSIDVSRVSGHDMSDFPNPAPEHPPVLLRNLHNLSLSCVGKSSFLLFSYILHTLKAPCLSSLTVNWGSNRESQAKGIAAIKNLLRRSLVEHGECNLESLNVLGWARANSGNEFDDFGRLLELTTRLKTLKVCLGRNHRFIHDSDESMFDSDSDDYGMSPGCVGPRWESFLRRLTLSESRQQHNSILVPRLKNLVLIGEFSGFPSALKNFLELRCDPPVGCGVERIDSVIIENDAPAASSEENEDVRAKQEKWLEKRYGIENAFGAHAQGRHRSSIRHMFKFRIPLHDPSASSQSDAQPMVKDTHRVQIRKWSSRGVDVRIDIPSDEAKAPIQRKQLEPPSLAPWNGIAIGEFLNEYPKSLWASEEVERA